MCGRSWRTHCKASRAQIRCVRLTRVRWPRRTVLRRLRPPSAGCSRKLPPWRRRPRAPSSFVTPPPYGFCRPCKGSGGREGGPIGGEAGACQVGVSHGDRGIHHCVLPVFPGRVGPENASSERTGRIVRPREDGHGIEPRGVRLALARRASCAGIRRARCA